MRLFTIGLQRNRYYSNDDYFVYLYGLGTATYVLTGLVSIFWDLGFYGYWFWGSKVAMLSVVIKYLLNTPHRIPSVFNYRTL